MTTGVALITAEELLDIQPRHQRSELIHGELITIAPSGPEHGAITFNIAGILREYIKKTGLGRGFGAETGFILQRHPDTVRAPDCAFIRKERLPADSIPKKFWAIAPDLVVEVLSPSDAASDVNEKIDQWLAAGTALVWVVDPKTLKVAVYAPNRQPLIVKSSEVLSGEDILPGLTIAVSELFE